MNLTVYHAPGSCSRVTLNALEEVGADYDDNTIAFMRGAQRTAEYLAINPKGKVPVLVADGQTVTETPSILFLLDQAFPTARLLPASRTGAALDMRGLSDLVWCAGTLHPLLHRFARSALYTDGGDQAPVRAAALIGLQSAAARISERIAETTWWYGETWSIVDTYLNWIFQGAFRAGLPADVVLDRHSERVESRPAFQRARAREIASVQRDALELMPGLTL